jgi:cell division protein FtsI (penicillin-binding protein 3)
MLFNEPVKVTLPVWRSRFLLVLLLVAFLVLFGKSLYMQTEQKEFLQARGAKVSERHMVLPSSRGDILDRNNDVLARSAPLDSIILNPPNVKLEKIDEANWQQLASLLEIELTALKEIFNQKDAKRIVLKQKLPPEVAAQIMELRIAGIYKEREYKRFYAISEEGAHLIGMKGLGTDKAHPNRGTIGLELQFNERLQGKDGARKVVKDRAGHIIDDLEEIVRPLDGDDVVLSIDRHLQHLAYSELQVALDKFKAKAGSAVMLDAKTGEILAMVNLPSFNPNNLKVFGAHVRNAAVENAFEPGSTMKAISVAAGLESGKFTPETKIETAPGYIRIGRYKISDSHRHEVLTVSEVVQKSSNVGTSKIAQAIGKEALWRTFKQVEFGQKTAVGFPGEGSGIVRHFKEWSDAGLATMSYGNGISVTLLQLARAYTVFANEGALLPVSIEKLEKAPVGVQVFSSKTANQIKHMLERVVLPGGTALKAQVAGYTVAGKTGTAYKSKQHEKGYEVGKYIGSFVGIVPASNPRLIMAVMIDEPSVEGRQYFGGDVAAPVFSAVMSKALKYLAVKQDAPNDNVVIGEDLPDEAVQASSVLEEKEIL